MPEMHICVRCAGRGPTCCEGSDRDIFITRGDVERIQTISGSADFYEFRKPLNPDYLDPDDPVWTRHVFRKDSSRRVIRRNASGTCMFLSKIGCMLPLQTRPLVCRLFPYQYSQKGLADEMADECPRDLLGEGESLAVALGIHREDAVLWHQLLYQEILREKEDE